MSDTQSDIDKLLAQEHWNAERKLLREILLDCGLEENVKWGKLCYAFDGGNVAIIFAMKDYCAVGFFKGSLLEDDENVLVSPGEHSQAMRQLRFTAENGIADGKGRLVKYIRKAIEVERQGLKVEFSEKDQLELPDELTEILNEDPEFAGAFDALTPGRRRSHVIHFTSAKQSQTRVARIHKSRAKILAGKGATER